MLGLVGMLPRKIIDPSCLLLPQLDLDPPSTNMSPHKRKRDTSTTSACYKRPRSDESSSPPPPERRLYNSEARDRPTQHAPSDFTYGQRVAVPELDGLHVDHDQDDETREQSEAVLAYLHSVR